MSVSNPPSMGLSLARQIAMMTYRTSASYSVKFARDKDDSGNWEVQNYLEYQVRFEQYDDGIMVY